MRVLAWLLVALFAVAPSGSGAQGQAARKARPARVDSILVRLGTETITAGMVQRRIDELPEHARGQFATEEGRQRLVERMVEERVWMITALKRGVADRPELRRQIEQQRRDLLIRTYVNEVMASQGAPSDSEAQAYYTEHPEDYRTPETVTLSHVLSRTEAEGKRVRQWSRAGQDWTKLAGRYSADTLTRARGGVLGPTTREGVLAHLGRQPALAESAIALGEGKIGGPYRTEHGWHVIRVDAHKPEGTRPFDQVRAGIVRQLGAKRSQDFYQGRLEEAKRALRVTADSAAIKAFVVQKKTAREMFNEAQLGGAPTARIDAYRSLLRAHPESEVSPQAAFMIGFIQSEELKDYAAADSSFREMLRRHSKSELAASAQWMLDHMRSESAPEFMNLESDSAKTAPAASGPGGKRKTP